MQRFHGKHEMKISVIIPTCQPGDYLYECLNSLKNQDFPFKDFEIIIILNGTQYPYEEKILNYAKTEMSGICVNCIYSGVTGVSNARNIGIENAAGEYILFVDDDDLISANYLKELYDNRVDNGVVVSNMKSFIYDVSSLFNDYLSNAYASNKETDPENIFKLRSFLSSSCAKLIPKELIFDSRFDSTVVIGEDSLFMFLLSDRIKTINLCRNSDVLYYRRVRPGSASGKKKSLFSRINLSCKLIAKYTIIYVKRITKYNFFLYLSRVAGSILSICYKPRVA